MAERMTGPGRLGEDGKIRYTGWPRGINNVKEETELRGDELRDSINYEFDAAGVPRLRPGRTRRVAGSACHSLWSNGIQTYYVDSGSLYSLNTDTWEKTALATGYSAARFSFAQIGHRLFFSNGAESGRIDLATNTARLGLGVSTPALSVTLTAQTFGGLPAGRYLVGITYKDAYGEESGCPGVSSVEIESGGSVLVEFSGPRPADATNIKVYLSEANGRRDEMFAYAEILSGDAQIQITTDFTGRPLETLYMETMPPCKYLTAYNGYLFGAIDNQVIHSMPQQYGLHDPDGGSVGLYPAPVTVLEHGPGGLFVVADRTYSYVGPAPGEFALRDDVFNHPGVAGSGQQVPANVFTGLENMPDADLPYWFTTRGAVLGMPGGGVLPLMKGRAEPERFAMAATGLVEMEGAAQVVTALQSKTGPADAMSMTDNFTVRVVNNGIADPEE